MLRSMLFVPLTNHELLKEATAYVSLEPCSHFGKTPPCANLLIEKKLQKVVVSNLDPNSLVAGKGLEKLKNAGIEVETGILEQEGWELNRRFFTVMTKKPSLYHSEMGANCRWIRGSQKL